MGITHACFNDLTSESVHLLTLLWELGMSESSVMTGNYDRLTPVQFGMNGSNLPVIQLDAIVCRIFASLVMARHLTIIAAWPEILPDVEITGCLYITMVLVAYVSRVAVRPVPASCITQSKRK